MSMWHDLGAGEAGMVEQVRLLRRLRQLPHGGKGVAEFVRGTIRWQPCLVDIELERPFHGASGEAPTR